MTRRRERGQALTEFAFVAPIIFLLLFGVIQIGLIMAAQNGLTDGVRSAARRAATYRINEQTLTDTTTFSAVCTAVSTQLLTTVQSEIPWFNSNHYTRSITYEWQADPTSGQWFLVAHVNASFGNWLFIPLDRLLQLAGVTSTSEWGSGYLTLSASEQMRIENPTLSTPSSTASTSC